MARRDRDEPRVSWQELERLEGSPLPDREAMSVIGCQTAEPAAVLDQISQVQGVPAAEQAPVGDERVTIMPVVEER